MNDKLSRQLESDESQISQMFTSLNAGIQQTLKDIPSTVIQDVLDYDANSYNHNQVSDDNYDDQKAIDDSQGGRFRKSPGKNIRHPSSKVQKRNETFKGTGKTTQSRPIDRQAGSPTQQKQSLSNRKPQHVNKRYEENDNIVDAENDESAQNEDSEDAFNFFKNLADENPSAIPYQHEIDKHGFDNKQMNIEDFDNYDQQIDTDQFRDMPEERSSSKKASSLGSKFSSTSQPQSTYEDASVERPSNRYNSSGYSNRSHPSRKLASENNRIQNDREDLEFDDADKEFLPFGEDKNNQTSYYGSRMEQPSNKVLDPYCSSLLTYLQQLTDQIEDMKSSNKCPKCCCINTCVPPIQKINRNKRKRCCCRKCID
ncbi:hypothetical protein GJ496_010506 [Pomphorhynchus laevis]|nr:hypothetical protein GJ496_010506 [Pomphorhynchus laevis]